MGLPLGTTSVSSVYTHYEVSYVLLEKPGWVVCSKVVQLGLKWMKAAAHMHKVRHVLYLSVFICKHDMYMYVEHIVGER